ncbi:MAG TPA: deoxyribonuclease IV [Pyrinomonadaceae bacterium]|nr:deoxyribonuclease IV [Pyrinomonadaceae bacterium]
MNRNGVKPSTQIKRSRELPRIGFHAPIKGGLQNALLTSKDLDCQAVQIFSRNPRGWKAKPLSDEEVELFKKVRRKTKITPIVIHANYLINLAAADSEMLYKSRESFREELERAILLGVEYLVLHPGSSRGACEADGINLCAESLKFASDGLDFGSVRILLENTAGQGDCIGHRFEHLRQIMAACPDIPLGVCFDTAHAFTAGYDIREESGLERTIRELDSEVGAKAVRAIHFNDSRVEFHSRVDRHWHIGQGFIGNEALRRVARHPKLAHSAFILETPYDTPRDNRPNIEALRRFVTDPSDEIKPS